MELLLLNNLFRENLITEAEHIEIKRLRVCAYARVSTDNEEQLNSYQSQLKYYDEKIMFFILNYDKINKSD